MFRRDVARLLVIATLNPLASGLLVFGLPWIALELGRSVAEAAGLSVLSTVAYLVTFVPAGTVGERLGGRRALRLSTGVQFGIAVAACVGVWQGLATLPLLVILSIALGAGTAIGITATYASTATLVDAEHLPLAYTHVTVGRQIGIFGGPALGGVVYGLGHGPSLVAAVVIVCGLSFLMAMLLQSPFITHHESSSRSWRQRVGAMVSDSQIRVLLAAGFVWNLPAAGALTLAVPLMHDRIHLSSLETSLVLAAGAVGSVSVAPLMRVVGGRVDLARVLIIGMTSQAAMLGVLSATVNLGLLIPIYGLMMMSNTTVAATVLTARAQRVAVEQQAAIVGLGMFVNMGGYVAGGALGALLARGIGLSTIYLLCGVAMLMCAATFGLLLRPRAAIVLAASAAEG